jgi:hypothetical protein
MDFSDSVWALTQTFPRGFYFLVDQLNRVALSIDAHIADGNLKLKRSDMNLPKVCPAFGAGRWI